MPTTQSATENAHHLSHGTIAIDNVVNPWSTGNFAMTDVESGALDERRQSEKCQDRGG